MVEVGLFGFALRLVAALAFGAAIGIERHWRQKSAGLRTNTLVSLGAAAFMLLSTTLGGDASGRIASYIVSGIGFLGAGVIMKDGLNVQGLNTAATIWCSAAVGAMSGMGLFAQAAMMAMAVMLTHIVLRPVGLRINKLTFVKSPNAPTDYRLAIRCRAEVENHLRVLLMQMIGNDEKLLLQSLTSDDTEGGVAITAAIKSATRQDGLIERLASRLTIEKKVTKVSWEITSLVDS